MDELAKFLIGIGILTFLCFAGISLFVYVMTKLK